MKRDLTEIGDYFVADFKERSDTARDRNNKITQVTNWSRQRPDLSSWKVKQY